MKRYIRIVRESMVLNTKKDIYIVYDKNTLKIVKTFTWFGKAEDFAKTNKDYVVINRTHPKNKIVLTTLK